MGKTQEKLIPEKVLDRWKDDTGCWTKGDFIVEEKEAERLEEVGQDFRTVERTERVCIPPDEFLFFSGMPPGLDKKSFDNLTDRLENKLPIDPLFMDVEADRRVSGHEGRHRAMAAICKDVESVPVILFMREGG